MGESRDDDVDVGGDGSDDVAAARLRSALGDSERLTGSRCAGCSQVICGHEAVFSLVLGYKNAPRCLGCVAAHMREPAAELRERTLTYVQHHDCFRAAWLRASGLEGFGDAARPPCLWSGAGIGEVAMAAAPAADPAAVGSVPATEVAARWHAGGMGCGDLLLELRLKLRALAPGAVFELHATDPGAPIDLPAWCGLTGHTLVAARHPVYWIRRRAD